MLIKPQFARCMFKETECLEVGTCLDVKQCIFPLGIRGDYIQGLSNNMGIIFEEETGRTR